MGKMRKYRLNFDGKAIASLLILGLFLRTLVAPGFMLNVTPGGGLDVVFCDGPVTLHEGHHGIVHHDGTHPDGDGASYISSICGFCFTSLPGLVTPGAAPLPVIPAGVGETVYHPSFISRVHRSGFSIRAPPLTS